MFENLSNFGGIVYDFYVRVNFVNGSMRSQVGKHVTERYSTTARDLIFRFLIGLVCDK